LRPRARCPLGSGIGTHGERVHQDRPYLLSLASEGLPQLLLVRFGRAGAAHPGPLPAESARQVGPVPVGVLHQADELLLLPPVAALGAARQRDVTVGRLRHDQDVASSASRRSSSATSESVTSVSATSEPSTTSSSPGATSASADPSAASGSPF